MEKELYKFDELIQILNDQNKNFKAFNKFIIVYPEYQKVEEKLQNSRSKTVDSKECGICGTKFRYGNSRAADCGLCQLFIECDFCKLYFEFNHYVKFSKKDLYEHIENNEPLNLVCSKSCSTKKLYLNQDFKQRQIEILIERWQDPDQAKLMMKGIEKYRNSEGFIEKNREIANRNWNNPKLKEIYLKHLKDLRDNKLNSYNIKYCQICNENTYHNGSICLVCFPDNRKKIGDKIHCAICGKKITKTIMTNMCIECYAISRLQIKNLSILDNLKLNDKILELGDIIKYKNQIGSIGIYGTYLKDNKKYALNAGKSNDLYKEIRKFISILSSPDKQIPYGDKRDLKFKDYGRWYDITHNYKNFQIVLLTNENCTEEEALLSELKFALDNEAFFQFDENHKKLEGTHGYWMR